MQPEKKSFGHLTPARVAGTKKKHVLFYSDTMKSGQGKSNPELVRVLANKSTEVMGVFQSIGIELNQVSICGGHSVARTHKPKEGPVGYNLVMGIYNAINKKYATKVTFITEAKAAG